MMMTLCGRSAIEKCEAILCMEYDEVRQDILSQVRKANDPALFAVANHIDDGRNWAQDGKFSVADFELLCKKTAQLRKIEHALHQIRAGSDEGCACCSYAEQATA